jgi:hypothetical protein
LETFLNKKISYQKLVMDNPNKWKNLSKPRKVMRVISYALCVLPFWAVYKGTKYAAGKSGAAVSKRRYKKNIKRAGGDQEALNCTTIEGLENTLYVSEAVSKKHGGDSTIYCTGSNGKTHMLDLKTFKKEVDPVLEIIDELNSIAEIKSNKDYCKVENVKEQLRNEIMDTNIINNIDTILTTYEEKGIIKQHTITVNDTSTNYYGIVNADLSKRWMILNNEFKYFGSPDENYSGSAELNKLNVLPKNHYKNLSKRVTKENMARVNKVVGDVAPVRNPNNSIERLDLGTDKLTEEHLGKEIIFTPNQLKAYNLIYEHERKNTPISN